MLGWLCAYPAPCVCVREELQAVTSFLNPQGSPPGKACPGSVLYPRKQVSEGYSRFWGVIQELKMEAGGFRSFADSAWLPQ